MCRFWTCVCFCLCIWNTKCFCSDIPHFLLGPFLVQVFMLHGSGQSPLLRGKGWEVHIRSSLGQPKLDLLFLSGFSHYSAH